MQTTKMAQRIAENIRSIQKTLPAGVTLMAVTKYHDLDETRAVIAAGVRDLGENKVQDLVKKMDAIDPEQDAADPVRWHLIGHLQTNKVRPIIGRVAMIHSVDSLKLLSVIDKESERAGVITDVLLQFNLAEEETKSGFAPSEFEGVMAQMPDYTHVRLRGLMTMGPLTKKSADISKIFIQLRKIYDTIKEDYQNGDHMIDTLSMGMTDDYPLAVAAGSTIVRIGRKIFESQEGEKNGE